MEQKKELKATPVKRVAQLKRRTSGAERTIASCNKKIKLLQQKLKQPKLSFSERQFIQGKITSLKVKRYNAQMTFWTNDKVFRGVVRQNNMIQKDQFRGQRYEDRILAKDENGKLSGYDKFYFDWRVSLEAAAMKDSKIRELQIALIDLAGGDDPKEFNKQTMELLELVDPTPVEILKHTKRLKPRLLKSLDTFFSEGPKYLPDARAARMEKIIAESGSGSDVEDM
jgi:hypothetical protein